MKGVGILIVLPPETPLRWHDYYRNFGNTDHDFGWIQGRFLASDDGTQGQDDPLLEFGLIGEGARGR